MDGSIEKKNVVARATIWYSISNILLRGISFFTAPIFTRLLSPGDYGIASNFSAWATLIMCFTGLGLSTAAIRGKIEYENHYNGFLSSIQCMGGLAAILTAACFCYTLNFWEKNMALDKPSIICMMLYLVFYPSVGYAQVNYRFEYKYKENIVISVVNTVGTVVGSIIFILLLPEKRYLGRIMGMALPSILLGIYCGGEIFKKGKVFINTAYWKYAAKISLPMVPHGLAMVVLAQIDRIMILRYCGEAEAGIYSFGYSYAVLLAVLTNAINDAVQPQMYGMLGRENDRALSSYTYKLIDFGILVSTGIIVVAPEILHVLGTAEYYSAIHIIYPVVVGTLVQFIYQFFGVVEIYYKKTMYMAIGSVGAAVLNLVLNSLFIPKYGFVAAAYTTMASYTMLMVFHFVAARLSASRVIYKARIILKLVALMNLLGIGFTWLHHYSWLIRYSAYLILTLGFAYKMRNDLYPLIRSIKSKLKR